MQAIITGNFQQLKLFWSVNLEPIPGTLCVRNSAGTYPKWGTMHTHTSRGNLS